MSTIQDLFQQAQLAEAAYANFIDPITGLPYTDQQKIIDALQDKNNKMSFSPTQAAAFVAQWRVVDQLPNTSSGFSATVFQNNDTGQYVFAVRGSENLFSLPGVVDWGSADLNDIGKQGIALHQALDLYNYQKSLDATHGVFYQAAYLKTALAETALLTPLWLQAQTTLLSAPYEAYKTLLESEGFWVDGGTVSTLALGNSNEVAATGLETGRGLQLGTGFDVVGHSLGGHLAMILGRLDGLNVASVETFNPPFFDPDIVPGLFSDQFTERFFSQLQQLENTAYGTSNISPTFAQSQNYVISGDVVHDIGTMRPGIQNLIFSETETSNPISAHSISQMTDSMAVYNLLASVGSNLSEATDANLQVITDILKASSNVATNSLESAVNALIGLFDRMIPPLVTDNLDDRESLYQRIQALTDRITLFQPMSIVGLVGKEASELKTLAEGDIAYRYALKELNPFAVTGNEALYTPYNVNQALGIYDATLNPDGQLTERYLDDRSVFLSLLIQSNLVDDAHVDVTLADAKYNGAIFIDRNSQVNVYNSISLLSILIFDAKHYIFGDQSNNTMIGGEDIDHLYGQVGNDALIGGLGVDYLEGGEGNDYLIHNDGSLADDNLSSAPGPHDILVGGKGYDSYFAGFGDVIEDSDRTGQVVFENKKITGGTRAATDPANQYKDPANVYLYNYDPASLILTVSIIGDSDQNHVLTINNFVSGALGIELKDAPPPPVINLTFTGTEGNDSLPDDPNLPADPGNLEIYALGGNDYVIGFTGDDLIYGGTGDDGLYGNAGNDTIYGEAGMDGLYGGAGNDRLDGGTENDQVDGQGDDDLWGDAEYAAFSQLWGRTVTNGVINYVLEQDFCGISLAVSGDDRLFGGGGISANGIWGTDLAIQRVGQK